MSPDFVNHIIATKQVCARTTIIQSIRATSPSSVCRDVCPDLFCPKDITHQKGESLRDLCEFNSHGNRKLITSSLITYFTFHGLYIYWWNLQYIILGHLQKPSSRWYCSLLDPASGPNFCVSNYHLQAEVEHVIGQCFTFVNVILHSFTSFVGMPYWFIAE